ncbi:hypothetical protein AAEX63_07495 [Luteococcus sp. H138]
MKQNQAAGTHTKAVALTPVAIAYLLRNRPAVGSTVRMGQNGPLFRLVRA